MPSNSDPEWLRRLNRQMDELRKALDTPGIREAVRRINGMQSQLDQLGRVVRPQMEAARCALRAWQEGPGYQAAQQAAAQYQQLAEQLQRAVGPWRGQLPQIMEAAASAARAALAVWEASAPANWRDLGFDEIEQVLDLMEESGWALVWTPRVEIVRALVETDADLREEKLLSSEQDVLNDLHAAADEVARPELSEFAEANREAIESYREGRLRASQALATVLFTSLFHRYVSETFAEGRTTLEPLDPRDATLGDVRSYCVLRAVLVAIDTYRGRDDEPIPIRFNRHASTHRLSPEQYTKLNALAALMLTTSLLREVQEGGALLPHTSG